ncbi:MAG: hypothetical protein V4496_03490 [Pseudomonadota bacterium]
MRLFDLPRDVIIATAAEWLNPKELFQYLIAMRVDNALRALLYLQEIFQVLSTSKSETSAECQRLFANFFLNLPTDIRSGLTITESVEENLYEWMNTQYSSPQHRAQMLCFISAVKGRPIVLDKAFSKFLRLPESAKKEVSVEDNFPASESLDFIVSQLDIQNEADAIQEALQAIQKRVPEMTKDFINNNSGLIEKLVVLFCVRLDQRYLLNYIFSLAVEIFVELTPLFSDENLVKLFHDISQKFIDQKDNEIEWYEPLTAIAENLSTADAESLFKYSLQALNVIEVMQDVDNIMRCKRCELLFILAPCVSTVTINSSHLQNDWLPLLTQISDDDSLTLGLGRITRMHVHFTREGVESQKIFNKLLNIFNHKDETIDIDFKHREVALTELIWLIEEFYAFEISAELENFVKEIFKLFKKQDDEIKLGLDALDMLISIIDSELLVEIVEKHKLCVTLNALLQHNNNKVRLSVLTVLQSLAYNSIGMNIKTIAKIALRFIDKNEDFASREIALDILTLLIVQGMNLINLCPLQNLKSYTQVHFCLDSWVIVEHIQEAYCRAQNLEFSHTI